MGEASIKYLPWALRGAGVRAIEDKVAPGDRALFRLLLKEVDAEGEAEGRLDFGNREEHIHIERVGADHFYVRLNITLEK